MFGLDAIHWLAQWSITLVATSAPAPHDFIPIFPATASPSLGKREKNGRWAWAFV
jgi:hypothetical protein